MSNVGNQELGDIILGNTGESPILVCGQAQSKIINLDLTSRLGTSNTVSGRTFLPGYNFIEIIPQGFGQAQVLIKTTYTQSGQAQTLIVHTYYQAYGQSNASIKQTYPLCVEGEGGGALLGSFVLGENQLSQTGGDTECIGAFGQAQATLLPIGYTVGYGQAQTDIRQIYNAYGQVQGYVRSTFYGSGQAQALSNRLEVGTGQAQANILSTYVATGQAQATILQTYMVCGQSQAYIVSTYTPTGQSQAYILRVETQTGQSQAQIKQAYAVHGQTQAKVAGDLISAGYGQAQAEITYYYVLDTFTRTTAYGAGLGSPDIGPDLTPMFDDEFSTYDTHARVVDGEFKHRYNSDFDDTWVEYAINVSDIDYRAEFRFDGTSLSYIEFDARVVRGEFSVTTNVWTGYQNATTWRLSKQGGTAATGTLPFVMVVGIKYAVHLQVEGTNARVNVWQADESEPVGWLIERSDINNVPGGVAIYAAASSGSNTRVDNISVMSAYLDARLQTKIAQAQALIHVPYVNAQAQAVINVPIKNGQASVFIYPGFEMEMGQAQATITPQYLIFLDTFTREIDGTAFSPGTLGQPDKGRYTYFYADELAYSLGTRLETVSSSGANELFAEIFPPQSQTATITYDFYSSQYSNFEFDGYYQIEVSNSNSTTGLYLYLNTSNTGIDDQFIMKFYDTSQLSVPFNLVNSQTYRIRLSIGGTMFQGKIWNIVDPEPDWILQAPQTAFEIGHIYINTVASTVPDGTINAIDNISVYSTTYPVTQQYGQARALIHRYQGYGQARARIPTRTNRHGQARAFIRAGRVFGQARATIKGIRRGHGQSRAFIKNTYIKFGQTNALISSTVQNSYGQAQALIDSDSIQIFGQARTFISSASYYLVDTFTRIKSGEMGIPDVGPEWEPLSLGDLSAAEVDGSRLKLTSNGSYQYIAGVSPLNVKNVGLYFEYEHLNHNAFTGFYLQDTLTGNDYTGFENNSLGSWFIISVIGGVSSTTGPQYLGLTSGTTYSVRFIIQFSSVKLKIWEKNTPEPEEWLLTLEGAAEISGGLSFYIDLTEAALVSRYIDNINVYKASINAYGQARSYIIGGITLQSGQAAAFTTALPRIYGQAQAAIVNTIKSVQAQAWIETTYRHVGQARANIELFVRKQGQARSYINAFNVGGFGQAQAYIYRLQGYGQAAAFILKQTIVGIGQAQATVKITTRQYGQSLALIVPPTQGYGQAQAKLNSVAYRLGQAKALIVAPSGYGQAQAFIAFIVVTKSGQAQGLIEYIFNPTGLSRAVITKPSPAGQSQARIYAFGQRKIGNAQAYVRRTDAYIRQGQAGAQIKRHDATGQANALIEGGRYLVKYNGYNLPGYAQSESFDSITRVHISDSTYRDGPFTEYSGLDNKIISLSMLVVGSTYQDVKSQTQKAATIVRSSRGWAKLYIQRYDRYYTVLTKKIDTDKSVGQTMRLLGYNVEFEAKPWLTGDTTQTLTGTGIIDTDQVNRTYEDGGWTTAIVNLSGSGVTVSGYTEAGEFAGFITTSGIVYNEDYIISVGPGKTYFEINGASNCTITYHNQWYL